MWYDMYEDALFDFEYAVSEKLGREPLIAQPFEANGELARTRYRLVEEEADELLAALESEDLAAVAKECADLLYVTLGTMIAFGIPAWDVFKRVHENNMLKMANATFDGQKLIKPKNHPKVSLIDLLPAEEG